MKDEFNFDYYENIVKVGGQNADKILTVKLTRVFTSFYIQA